MSNSTRSSLHQAHRPLREPFMWRALALLSEPIRRFNAVNELEQLSDRQLRDIGVDRRQIEAVAEREIARLRAK